jgi:hypothetical protein
MRTYNDRCSERGYVMAVRVRYGAKDVIHPDGHMIKVNDGHLYVYGSHSSASDQVVAIYSPSNWSDARVTSDAE